MPFTPPTTVASVATTGYLAQFLIGSPLAAVAEIKTFKANLATVAEVPTSTLLSPNNTEEMIPSMIKPGTVEFTGNFTGVASQIAITPLMQAQTVFAFEIKAPMQSSTKTYTLTSQGFFTKYEVGPFELNKATEFSGTIQTTGTYVETVA